MTPTEELAQALSACVTAADWLAEAWEKAKAERGERGALADQLVGELAQLRKVTEPLALVDSDLSALVYDAVWAEYNTYEAEIAGTNVAVTRSKSYSTDSPQLLGVIAARMADELADVRMVDENGEMVPPGPAVERVVRRLAEVSSLNNASQSWAKTKLQSLGIDLDDFRTTTRGAKKVKLS